MLIKSHCLSFILCIALIIIIIIIKKHFVFAIDKHRIAAYETIQEISGNLYHIVDFKEGKSNNALQKCIGLPSPLSLTGYVCISLSVLQFISLYCTISNDAI